MTIPTYILNLLESGVRLELNATDGFLIELSKAISLRRIADALEEQLSLAKIKKPLDPSGEK